MTQTPNFDGRLIDLVRANPMLYERDIRSTPYELMKRKNELWHSIATSLRIDVKSCIMRWKNLRDKLRRELVKEMPGGGGSDWELIDRMRFVEQHIKYHSERQLRVQPQSVNIPLDDMNAELLIEELVEDEDDPLQEAMDEQSIERDKEIIVNIPVTLQQAHDAQNYVNINNMVPVATTADAFLVQDTSAKAEHMKRIETLLDGLGETNRAKAEKRIIAYLCQCNLRALNNDQIEDIMI